MTNYDRIKAMSVEEMAEFLETVDDIDYSITFCDLCHGQYDCTKDCKKHWLESEVEE